MATQPNNTFRTTLLVCGVASFVAFFLPLIDLVIVSLSGFDMLRLAFSGLRESMNSGPINIEADQGSSLTLYLPLLLPISGAAKLIAWFTKSNYSHVTTAVVSILIIAYYGLSSSFSVFGLGAWVWLAASVTCPIVAFSTADSSTSSDSWHEVAGQSGLGSDQCDHCGLAIEPNSSFCNNCGEAIT